MVPGQEAHGVLRWGLRWHSTGPGRGEEDVEGDGGGGASALPPSGLGSVAYGPVCHDKAHIINLP